MRVLKFGPASIREHARRIRHRHRVITIPCSEGSSEDPDLFCDLPDHGNGPAIETQTDAGAESLPSGSLRLLGHHRIGRLPRDSRSMHSIVDTVTRQRTRLMQVSGPGPAA